MARFTLALFVFAVVVAVASADFDFFGGLPSFRAAVPRDPRENRGPVTFPVTQPGSETSGVRVGASGYGFIPPGPRGGKHWVKKLKEKEKKEKEKNKEKEKEKNKEKEKKKKEKKKAWQEKTKSKGWDKWNKKTTWRRNGEDNNFKIEYEVEVEQNEDDIEDEDDEDEEHLDKMALAERQLRRLLEEEKLNKLAKEGMEVAETKRKETEVEALESQEVTQERLEESMENAKKMVYSSIRSAERLTDRILGSKNFDKLDG